MYDEKEHKDPFNGRTGVLCMAEATWMCVFGWRRPVADWAAGGRGADLQIRIRSASEADSGNLDLETFASFTKMLIYISSSSSLSLSLSLSLWRWSLIATAFSFSWRINSTVRFLIGYQGSKAYKSSHGSIWSQWVEKGHRTHRSVPAVEKGDASWPFEPHLYMVSNWRFSFHIPKRHRIKIASFWFTFFHSCIPLEYLERYPSRRAYQPNFGWTLNPL